MSNIKGVETKISWQMQSWNKISHKIVIDSQWRLDYDMNEDKKIENKFLFSYSYIGAYTLTIDKITY